MGLCRAEIVGIVKKKSKGEIKNTGERKGCRGCGDGIHELVLVTREENISCTWAQLSNVISLNVRSRTRVLLSFAIISINHEFNLAGRFLWLARRRTIYDERPLADSVMRNRSFRGPATFFTALLASGHCSCGFMFNLNGKLAKGAVVYAIRGGYCYRGN